MIDAIAEARDDPARGVRRPRPRRRPDGAADHLPDRRSRRRCSSSRTPMADLHAVGRAVAQTADPGRGLGQGVERPRGRRGVPGPRAAPRARVPLVGARRRRRDGGRRDAAAGPRRRRAAARARRARVRRGDPGEPRGRGADERGRARRADERRRRSRWTSSSSPPARNGRCPRARWGSRTGATALPGDAIVVAASLAPAPRRPGGDPGGDGRGAPVAARHATDRRAQLRQRVHEPARRARGRA